MLLHRRQQIKTTEAEENMEDTPIIEAEEDVAPNVEEIGDVVVASVHPVI